MVNFQFELNFEQAAMLEQTLYTATISMHNTPAHNERIEAIRQLVQSQIELQQRHSDTKLQG